MYHPTALYFPVSSSIISTTPPISTHALSYNVVGYTATNARTESETESQVYTLCAIPFTGVDGGNLPVSALNFANPAMGDDSSVADIIQIWDGEGGFNDFYCWTDGVWYNVADNETPLDVWYEDGIPAGTPFWYISYRDGTREGTTSATVSGGVETESFVSFDLRTASETEIQVFTLLNNPYPAPTKFDGVSCQLTGVAMGDDSSVADIIQIWDGEGGFNDFYCWTDGVWYNVADNETPLDVWYEDGIPAGTPFWYIAYRDGTREGTPAITFYNPL